MGSSEGPSTRADRASPRRTPNWLVVGLAIAVLIGVGIIWIITHRPTEERPPPPSAPWFADVTADSGVAFEHSTGADAGHLTILETLGGGVALLDYDGDGLLDIFVTGGGNFDKSRG